MFRNNKNDLHVHSNFSDGTETPSYIFEKAKKSNLAALALTDHDTNAGWDEAKAASAKTGVIFIPGMELTTTTPAGHSIHILSYLHDPENPALKNALIEQQNHRRDRAKLIVQKLSTDLPLTWDDIIKNEEKKRQKTSQNQISDSTVGRPHIADVLIEKGFVHSREEAFNTLLSNPKYYVPLASKTPAEGIKLIRQAGGVSILAHGLAKARNGQQPIQEIKTWIEAGLNGVEIYHREHSENDQKQLHQLAQEHDLIITGSSDYHGEQGKPNKLGEHTTRAEQVKAIVRRGSGTPVFYSH